MRPRPDISAIVCTRNRAASLRACLDSLAQAAAACRHAWIELVVIDNGSTDGTGQMLRNWAADIELPVVMATEPRPGVANARNTALRVANGAMLAFTDDDCVVRTDYFTRLRLAFAGDDGPVLRGGRVELGDARDIAFTLKLDDAPARFDEGMHPGGFLLGCNMSMTREAADRIGGFDSRFGAGAAFESAEDTDYIYRAHRAGVAVIYDPSVVVFHHHGRRRRADILRLHRGYNIGNGALYMKHAPRDPRLLLHFLWDLRDGILEGFGGATFNAELGLSYRSKAAGNLVGAGRYLARAVRALPRFARDGKATAPA